MPVKIWRLPRTVIVPDFKIKVEVITMTDLDQAEYVYGNDGGVIRIGKGMSVGQKRFYFSHELIHAAVDYHLKQVLEGGHP